MSIRPPGRRKQRPKLSIRINRNERAKTGKEEERNRLLLSVVCVITRRRRRLPSAIWGCVMTSSFSLRPLFLPTSQMKTLATFGSASLWPSQEAFTSSSSSMDTAARTGPLSLFPAAFPSLSALVDIVSATARKEGKKER